MTQPRDIRIAIESDGGTMWATVDELPGVFATGDSLDELRDSLAEAIALYLTDAGEQPRAIDLGTLRAAPSEARAQLVVA